VSSHEEAGILSNSINAHIKGLMAGREGEKEQELQKYQDEEAAKQAEIKKKLKSFISTKLMKLVTEEQRIHIYTTLQLYRERSYESWGQLCR